jgi:arrestin-related trafficking adapter 3/6
MGSVRYELDASIERAGAFKSNLAGKTEVLLVRNPGEQNLEIHEPISITRTWYFNPCHPSNEIGRTNYTMKY